MSIPVHPSKALQFFDVVGRLKTLKRTGWVNNRVSLPESVADHMYRMSMMAFLITDPLVNKDKLQKICLVHDLAESIVGDITPYDGITKEEKRKLEEDALRNILKDIGHDDVSQELLTLWLEYEEGTSLEADIARQFDKFEMIVQANEYEIAQSKVLQRFYDSTEGVFQHPEVKSWAAALFEERKRRLSDAIASPEESR